MTISKNDITYMTISKNDITKHLTAAIKYKRITRMNIPKQVTVGFFTMMLVWVISNIFQPGVVGFTITFIVSGTICCWLIYITRESYECRHQYLKSRLEMKIGKLLDTLEGVQEFLASPANISNEERETHADIIRCMTRDVTVMSGEHTKLVNEYINKDQFPIFLSTATYFVTTVGALLNPTLIVYFTDIHQFLWNDINYIFLFY